MSATELELIEQLGIAHNKSTFRACPSSLAVQLAAQGCGDLFRSMAAALVCFGGRHGPVEATYDLLLRIDVIPPAEAVSEAMERYGYVPGWGSSFVSGGEIDPIWSPIHERLSEQFPAQALRLAGITDALYKLRKSIQPNPSAYTAITAIIVGMPRRLSPYLLIAGRLSGWAEIFVNETKGK